MTDLPILSKDFLAELDKLCVIAGRLSRKSSQGRNTGYRKGSSLEFREYRPYQSGDDLRFVDWDAWNRLGRILTKQFASEQDRSLYLLIDSSKSMDFGEPTKHDFAVRTAAALSYIAARSQDRVGVFSLSDRINSRRIPRKGPSAAAEIFGYLDELRPEGETDLNTACSDFLSAGGGAAVAVIISDFMDEKGYREAVEKLIYRRFDLILIHILSEDEAQPKLDGRYRIKDSENGSELKIDINGDFLKHYRSSFAGYCSDIEKFCRSRGVQYSRTLSSANFESFILSTIAGGSYFG